MFHSLSGEHEEFQCLPQRSDTIQYQLTAQELTYTSLMAFTCYIM